MTAGDVTLNDKTSKRQKPVASLPSGDCCRIVAESTALVSEGVVAYDAQKNLIFQNEHAASWMQDVGDGLCDSTVHSVLSIALSGSQTMRSLDTIGPPPFALTVSGSPVYSESGEIIGAVAVIEDTTEKHHLETVRRDFVANVSHELKTPVGALGLLAETMMVEEDPEVMRRLLQRMHVESVRVGQVIDDLLNLSRIESPNAAAPRLLKAKELVESAANRVRFLAEHRLIAINVGGDANATVFGQEREIISAVHHLLENALKYSGDGSTVEADVKTSGDWTEISVADHGVGIAPHYLDRIFERFYRVDDARTRATGGTGLGLSIVRHVVQNHGGEVRVASTEGEGSTFTVRFAAHASKSNERVAVQGGTDG